MTALYRAFPVLAATVLAASAASAERVPVHARTRLDRCGAEACLVVRGHRADASATVSLAGHDVAVQGDHSWRVALPLATLRAWSAPLARSILVRVAGTGEAEAALPIGLLGRTTQLAFLDVSASH